jgi:hypothetical protein
MQTHEYVTICLHQFSCRVCCTCISALARLVDVPQERVNTILSYAKFQSGKNTTTFRVAFKNVHLRVFARILLSNADKALAYSYPIKMDDAAPRWVPLAMLEQVCLKSSS